LVLKHETFWSSKFNGHFRILNSRYLPYIRRPI
jgi:hypothetical protein